MKIHVVPTSTTSRPVLLFISEADIVCDRVVVDFKAGEQKKEPFLSLNAMAQVPVLEDGDLVLTESSAIMKYLADLHDAPAYPRDLRERARVNERMDWFNTDFFRDFGYNLIYPQVFRHHRRDESAQAATIEWGRKKAVTCLEVLDRRIGSHPFVCGERITLADYFGAELVATGDLIRIDLDRFANVARWMSTMRQLSSWKAVNEGLASFAAALRERQFVTIS